MSNRINEKAKRKLDRPITGVIHKDRIWEQWYSKEALETKLPEMNQADYMLECNEGYEHQTILNNRGMKSISVEQVKAMINFYAKSLRAYEIGEGDFVATIALTTPELIALKYACAKIGACTANLNYQDAESDKLYNQLHLIKPRMIFTLDIFENKISSILNLEEFKDTIKVRLPLSVSTPILNTERVKISLLKSINSIKKLNINDSISFTTFKNASVFCNKKVESIYHKGMPANIAFTSGTTGVNKAVLLSHDANNALAEQHKRAQLGLERGKKNLALVPPFLAIWDADIIHTAMSLGLENVLELALTFENVAKYLKKYSPQYGIWSQYLWESLLYLPENERAEVAKTLEKAVVGGERGEINPGEVFEQLTGVVQVAGYGATEMDSCFSVAHPNCNVPGSAGLPLPFNNVRVVGEGMKDLTYNQPGRLFLTGPCMMNGYYGREDLTAQVLMRDNEGTLWYDTKDYGYVDITGSIVPIDRDQAPIVIKTPTMEKNVKLLDVNEKIKESKSIKLCKMDSYCDFLVSHIELNNFSDNSIPEMLEDVKNTITKNLEKEEQPHIINILSSLPRTPLGKVDYPALHNMTKELVLQKSEEIMANSNRLMICDNTNQMNNCITKQKK